MKTLLMHSGAFGLYLFALAVYNVAFTIGLYFLLKEIHEKAGALINQIGTITYYTASFIS